MNKNNIDPEQLAEFLALLASPMSLHHRFREEEDEGEDEQEMKEDAEDIDSLQDALRDGVIVLAKDPKDLTRSYEAVYLFGQFFPRTRESVQFWANATLSDIYEVHRFTDISQLNEFFWADAAIDAEPVWQKACSYEGMSKSELIELVKKLRHELDEADQDRY